MSLSNNHKIHTTSLEVQFEGIEEGLGLQDRLALVFHEKVMPALEKEFDAQVNPDSTLVLDSLIIDCGFLTSENWEELLLQNILEQVRKELASNLSNKSRFYSKENKANEVFFFFMDKGYFPWNSPFSFPNELEKALEIDRIFFEKLAKAIQKTSLVIDRLFKSFSQKFISKIYESLGEVLNPKVFAVYKYLQKHGNEKIQKELLFVFLTFTLKKKSLSNLDLIKSLIFNSKKEGILILKDFFRNELINDKDFKESFLSIFSELQNPEKILLIDYLLKGLHESYPDLLKTIGISISKIKSIEALKKLPKSTKRRLKYSENTSDISQKPESRPINEQTTNIEEDIFIENAGLILLHPFIAGLFTNLELVKNQKFENPSKQHLAAKILQFLIYGENELSENYFVLNKLLCGMDLYEVLPLTQEIDLKSQKECENLLQIVIGHWAILKNTSVEGLRETFLQRSGKLSRVDKGWKLTVERKTVDILLDKLPWGIGLIKLPWMNEMMYVDWN
ncbi:contractile injection system tape measure protein [Algoriphagus sp.]|uniref:contractile injection system tape measure protein n=1 Tax=Algoriphagus sp. TaxID=1872435 RepID=UPI0025DBC5EA|nr:contractile injection system tape measure protein [Algoriphagus sp.]